MNEPQANTWHSVRWGRVITIILVIIACLALPFILAYGAGIALLFGLFLLLTKPVEPQVILIYAVLIVAALVAVQYVSRSLPRRTKVLRFFVSLGIIGVATFMTYKPATIVYEQYRIIQTTPKMETFLEKRYNQDFVIIEAKSCRDYTKFGASSHSYVCAKAYSKSNPKHVFPIKENQQRYFEEEYLQRPRQ